MNYKKSKCIKSYKSQNARFSCKVNEIIPFSFGIFLPSESNISKVTMPKFIGMVSK
jgi:hypothetical protein